MIIQTLYNVHMIIRVGVVLAFCLETKYRCIKKPFFQNFTEQNLAKMYLCALNHLALCTWAAETENYNQMRGIDDGTHHTVTSRLVLRFFQCPLNSEKP